ncbi:MAG: hypothetical protein IAI49_01655, partial [Candidatus Eremiobacteraeota bacterium]|nr:hypothetical protein [Candidatus Eremiobacteraeota bacterium]
SAGYKDDDLSNIVFVDPDTNSFRIAVGDDVGGGNPDTWSGGQTGDGMIMSLPFHLLSDEPSTPFWDVAAILAGIALIVVVGDADTTQLSDGNGRTFYRTLELPIGGGEPGGRFSPLQREARIREINTDPASRLPNAAPVLLSTPRDPATPFDAYTLQRTPPLRRAGQTTAVPDVDANSLVISHAIAPKASGTYQWMMRGPGGAVIANVEGGLTNDTIQVTQIARAAQAVTFTTASGATPKKTTLTLVGPQMDSSVRSFALSEVAIAPGQSITVHLENAGQELIVQNSGAPLQVTLNVQAGTQAGAVATRPGLTLAAGVTRLKPTDWSVAGIAHSTVSTEQLDRVGGTVLKHALI